MKITDIERIIVIDDVFKGAQILLELLSDLHWILDESDKYFPEDLECEISSNLKYLEDKVVCFCPDSSWNESNVNELFLELSRGNNSIAFIDFRLIENSNVEQIWYKKILLELENTLENSPNNFYLERSRILPNESKGAFYLSYLFNPDISYDKGKKNARLIFYTTLLSPTFLPLNRFSIKSQALLSEKMCRNVILEALKYWWSFDIDTDLEFIWEKTSLWFKNNQILPYHKVAMHTDNEAEECLEQFKVIFGVNLVDFCDLNLTNSLIYRKIHGSLKHMCGAYYGGSEVIAQATNNLDLGSIFIIILLAKKHIDKIHENKQPIVCVGNFMSLDLESIFLPALTFTLSDTDESLKVKKYNCRRVAKCMYDLFVQLMDTTFRSDGEPAGAKSIEFPNELSININLNWDTEKLLNTKERYGDASHSLHNLKQIMGEELFDERFKFNGNVASLVARKRQQQPIILE
jgi:hypothetical protein